MFNLICDLDGTKDMIAAHVDNDGNHMLHLMGTLAPQNRLDNLHGVA